MNIGIYNTSQLLRLLNDSSVAELILDQLSLLDNDSLSIIIKEIKDLPNNQDEKYSTLLALKKIKLTNSLELNYINNNNSIKDLLILSSELFFNDISQTLGMDISKELDKLVEFVKSNIKNNRNPKNVFNVFNRYVADRFVIEYQDSIFLYNFEYVFKTNKINNISLTLLYLLIAEELKLPIFGLPIQDKLLLVYTKDHCTHCESVYSDDILFYFTPGSFGTLYTYYDLEQYSINNLVELKTDDTLPKSNIIIMIYWMQHLYDISVNNPKYHNISTTFQQVVRAKAGN